MLVCVVALCLACEVHTAAVCCITHSGSWSAVAVAGCYPRPSVQQRVWEVQLTQPVKEAQPVGSFCFLSVGKVVL